MTSRAIKPDEAYQGVGRLRAIAALMVIAGHYIGIPDGPDFWLWNIFHLGHFGVDLFSVLSGFLVTTILLENRAITGWHILFSQPAVSSEPSGHFPASLRDLRLPR
jgi:peptidoglycan/LPS O-acetylase OafA/YrhL